MNLHKAFFLASLIMGASIGCGGPEPFSADQIEVELIPKSDDYFHRLDVKITNHGQALDQVHITVRAVQNSTILTTGSAFYSGRFETDRDLILETTLLIPKGEPIGCYEYDVTIFSDEDHSLHDEKSYSGTCGKTYYE